MANFEPLALLVLVPLARLASGRGATELRRCRAAFLVILGQMIAYVPFYFDGDYPGGGARFSRSRARFDQGGAHVQAQQGARLLVQLGRNLEGELLAR